VNRKDLAEMRRRLDRKMQDAREGFLLAGGDEKDWPSQEKQFRAELLSDEAKAAAQATHAEAFRQTKRNF
jgi:hypothetical protein